MTGPPTPVSGCPLIRWEIREGSSTRVFQSIRPHNMFTLTIEGERPVDSEPGTLIFLIHLGPNQLMSIRLHDLLKTYGGSTDMVNIDKRRHEICIKILGQNRTVAVQFEEKRDFTVAVCMFQKSHLPINDSISHTFSTSTMTPPPYNSPGSQTASVIGPRLSSITPLPRFLTSGLSHSLGQEEAPSAFTEQWDSPMSFPRHENSPEPSFQNPQRLYSLPTYASASSGSQFVSDAISQQLNPYNLFLSRRSSQTHTPRVGSPLKQSTYPKESESQSSISNNELNPHLNVANFPHNVCDSSLRYPTSSGTPGSPDQKECFQIPKNDGPELNQSVITLPQASSFDTDPKPLREDATKSFRDLMPMPRQLPFDSSSKRVAFTAETPSKVPINAPAKENPREPLTSAHLAEATGQIPPEGTKTKSPTKILAQKCTAPSITRTGPKNSTRASRIQIATEISTPKLVKGAPNKVSTRGRGRAQTKTLTEITSRETQVKRPTRASVRNASKAITTVTKRAAMKKKRELELKKNSGSAPDGGTHVDDTVVTSDGISPLEELQLKPTMNGKVQTDPAFVPAAFSSPTVLLTNPETLQELNRLTSKYLEQYVTDVETGSDERNSAWFYMDCIMNARREFWLNMLEAPAFNRPLEESKAYL